MTIDVSSRQSNSGVSLPAFLSENSPRYLLAQHTPDTLRQEPRNIGIILWTEGRISAHFLAERHDAPNGVDSRKIPHFISIRNANTYIQWVKHWRYLLRQETITPVNGGIEITAQSPEFLQALQGYGGESYSLIDGGYFLDEVTADNIEDAAAELFDTLVKVETEMDAELEISQPRLNQTVKRLFDRSGLSRHPNFLQSYPVYCRINSSVGSGNGDLEEIKFSYAFGNGTPQFLYQNVPLPRQSADLNRSVRSTAWMFEQVLTNNILDPNHCRALVYFTEQRSTDTETKKAIKTLASLVTVVNVHNPPKDVLTEFTDLAKSEITHEGIDSLFAI